MAVAVRAQLTQVELLLAASEPDDDGRRLPAPSEPAEAECSAEDEAVERRAGRAVRGAAADPRQVQLGF